MFSTHDSDEDATQNEGTKAYVDEEVIAVQVDFKVLCAVTNSFNKRTHLIGEGASCMVYRGNVYGYPTAIKVFNEDKGAW